jgi:hypothetical protein
MKHDVFCLAMAEASHAVTGAATKDEIPMRKIKPQEAATIL